MSEILDGVCDGDCAYWKIVTAPPADSIPALTDSATEYDDEQIDEAIIVVDALFAMWPYMV